jgi:carbamoyl-phosphate synthase large subunit
LNILIEASGSLTSGYIIKAIKDSGNRVIGSDISDFNHAKVMCDDFILMPKHNDKNLWEKISTLLDDYNIDIVIPSFDETLLGWSERVSFFRSKNIKVIISPVDTIKTFQDKWIAFRFFKNIGILTPKSSLKSEFEIIKPRVGRGGSGIFLNDFKSEIDMTNMISQKKIIGQEYTVDCFFDVNGRPIYIIPRERLNVIDGKSSKGIVVKNLKIEDLVKKISLSIKFRGPINFQFFITDKKEIYILEINTRIAGGMALGFAASENWIELIIQNFINSNKIRPKKIKYGMKMSRYYDEIFI